MEKHFMNNLKPHYILRDIKRYNNSFKIKEESVAEHCFFVALILFHLKDRFEFDLDKALKMAIIHDLPEIYITDIPHNVKKKFPYLGKIIKQVEVDTMLNDIFDGKYLKLFQEFEDGISIESRIVQLADAYSVLLYAENEVKLGNDGMKIIREDTKERISQTEESILASPRIEKEIKESINFVIFEGVDRVGKSTIHKAFDKAVNYKYMSVERMHMTYVAYCLRYKRPIDQEIFKNIDKNRCLFVYLCASIPELEARRKVTLHEEVDWAKDIRSFIQAKSYLRNLGFKVVVASTEVPLDTTIEIILNRLGDHI